ncbi:hypothetical protein ACFQX4_11815 [Roseomonas sp. GCM10028921]
MTGGDMQQGSTQSGQDNTPLWPVLCGKYFRGKVEKYSILRGFAFILHVFTALVFLTYWLLSSDGAQWVLLSISALFFLGFLTLNALEDIHRKNEEKCSLLNKTRLSFESPTNFVLFLRSFNSELLVERTKTVTPVKRERTMLVRGEIIPTGETYTDYVYSDYRDDDIREFLSNSCNPIEVVLIDGDITNISSSLTYVHSSDDGWYRIFEVFRDQARAIFILPEGSKSLKREISDITSCGELDKCLFLMPPSRVVQYPNVVEAPGMRHKGSENSSRSWVSGSNRRNNWQTLSEDFILPLPDYIDNGGIFTYNADGTLNEFLSFDSQLVAAKLEDLSGRGAPLKQALLQLLNEGVLATMLNGMQKEAMKLEKYYR